MKTNRNKNVLLNGSSFRIALQKRFASRWLLALFFGLFAGSIATAQTQEREQPYVVSKEGRRYPVEPAESYRRRLAEARSRSLAEKQSTVALQSRNAAATPPSHSLALYQTRIKDQMDRGSCWAFAGIAALEAAYRRKHNLTLDLSEQYAFHMLKAMELLAMIPENNTSLVGFQGSSDIVQKLSRYAIPEERFAPYLNGTQMEQLRVRLNVGDIVNTPTQIGYDTFEFSEEHIPTAARWNAKYQVTDYGWVSDPTDLAALEQTLADNHEIAADFDLRWRFNAARNVYEFDPDAAGGGHVMLIIGYDRTQQVFILKNSWGENAFIRVTYDFVKRCIGGAYYIKDVADPNRISQKQARFLGFWNFDDIHQNNFRVQGRLVIRRFTDLRNADPNAPTKLGSLYLNNGNGPLDVTGYFINGGEGVVLDIHIIPNQPAAYLRFTYPFGFWRFVDKNYAGSVELGTLEQPFRSFVNGANLVPKYGTVFVEPGSYAAVGVYNKPMTVKAPRGGVTLGNGN